MLHAAHAYELALKGQITKEIETLIKEASEEGETSIVINKHDVIDEVLIDLVLAGYDISQGQWTIIIDWTKGGENV